MREERTKAQEQKQDKGQFVGVLNDTWVEPVIKGDR